MRRGPKKEDEEDSKNEVRKRPRVAKKEEEEDGANLEKGELSIEAAGEEEWNQFRVESSELDLARPFGPFDGVVQKNLVDRYGKIAVYFVQNKFLVRSVVYALDSTVRTVRLNEMVRTVVYTLFGVRTDLEHYFE